MWALQCVVLLLLVGTWNTDALRKLRKYKSATWMVTVCAATLNMTVCCHLFRIFNQLHGDLGTRVRVTFSGFVAWDTFMLLTMFSGSAFAWISRHSDESDVSVSSAA